jgi:hypothetical protein
VVKIGLYYFIFGSNGPIIFFLRLFDIGMPVSTRHSYIKNMKNRANESWILDQKNIMVIYRNTKKILWSFIGIEKII